MSVGTNIAKTLNYLKQYGRSSYPSTYTRTYGKTTGPAQLTAYEQELLPYAQEAFQEKEKKRAWLQPIVFIFDLLQRGQYMSANTAQRITQNLQSNKAPLEGVPTAMWEGLTGKRKGTYYNVLFDEDEDTEYRGWLEDWGREIEQKRGGKFAKKVVGLAADILLDPTTYIPGFGAARAAKSAAVKHADDAVRLFSAGLTAGVWDDLLRTGQKAGLTNEMVEQAVKSGGKAVNDLVRRFGGDSAPKILNKLYRTAKKEALRLPVEKLSAARLGEIGGLREKIIGRAIPETMEGFQKAMIEGLPLGKEKALGTLDDMIKRIRGGEYAGAGTRAGRFFRKEFAVGERYPAIVKTWDDAIKTLQNSKLGGTFSNAWWAVMTNPKSPVAWLKRAFGVRSPYEKMLNDILKKEMAFTPYLQFQYADQIQKMLEPLGDAEQKSVRDILWSVQNVEDVDFTKIITEQGFKGEGAGRVSKAVADIQAFTASLRDEYKQLYNEGLLPKDIGDIYNYLPERLRMAPPAGVQAKQVGPAVPGFVMARTTTPAQLQSREMAVWKLLLGVDDAGAEQLIKGGYTHALEMDLETMLMGRAFVQARVKQRAGIIRQFKEFAISPEELAVGDRALGGWFAQGGDLGQLGLRQVKDPTLAGYLFDEEVADVLDKTLVITQNDWALKKLGQTFDAFTSWWKGWATLSSGFHMRNHYSNMITGFLKHGTDWLNPQAQYDAFVGSVSALYRDQAPNILKKMGVGENALQGVLARRYGDETVENLARLAAQRGIVTRAQMGFDLPKTVEEFAQKSKTTISPFSRQFVGMKVSRNIGNVVESYPRFLSFMLDYDTVVKQGGAAEGALDWAMTEAKKWFIDYTDLTKFEKGVMTKLVPFYCFDEKTEVLTPQGWKDYKTLQKNDPIFTVNMETQEIELQKTNAVAIFDYDDKLIQLKNRNYDALFTFNHKCIYQKRDTHGGKWDRFGWRWKEAKDLNTSDWLPIITKGWNENKRKIFTDDFVEIIGWIITEGTVNDIYVQISQSFKNHYQQIISCLDRLKYKYSTNFPNRINILKPHVDIIRGFLDKNKNLDLNFILQLTPKQMGILYGTMILGDGYHNWKDTVFIQKNDTTAINFQILCTLLGKSTKMFKKTKFSKGRFSESPINWLRIKRIKNVCVNKLNKKYILYKGKVWCPNTDNGTIIVKRNGIIYPTMQTWLRKNIANQISGMMEFTEMYCVPDTAEILTKEGWKKYTELIVDELVLTYNVHEDKQEWKPLIAINVFDYNGELIHFGNQYADFLSTSNHRWPVITQDHDIYQFRDTIDINTNCSLIINSSTILSEESILPIREAALLGWLVTDGCIWSETTHNHKSYNRMVISQSPRKYLDEIRKLAKPYLLGEHTNQNCDCVVLRLSYKFRDYLAEKGFTSKNDFPSIVTRLNREALEALWDAMFKAEGWITQNGQRCWVQKKGPILEGFQIASQLLGKRFGYYKIDNKGNDIYKGSLGKGKILNFADIKVTIQDFQGKVWCPSTENSTWVMRQNNKSIITGNSLLPKFHKAIAGYEPKAMPAYMTEGGYIPLWKSEQEGYVATLWPNFPYMDINKIPIMFEMTDTGIPIPKIQAKEIMNNILAESHPLLKTAYELAAGKDVFFKSEFEDQRRAPRMLRGLTRVLTDKPKVVQFVDGFLKAIGVADGLNAAKDEEGRLVMNTRIAKVLDNNLIMLKRIPQFFDLPEYFVPALEDIKYRVSGAKDDYERAEEGLQLLSFYLGIKFKTFGEEEQVGREAREVETEAAKKLQKERKKSPLYKQRSMNYIQRAIVRQRKLGIY